MLPAFYIAAAIAVIATMLAVTRLSAVHGLLYLVVSLLALAVVFYLLGAPFVAALEIIIYAGAIVVLFVFVVMLLNQGLRTIEIEKRWLTPRIWVGPAILAFVLAAEFAWTISSSTGSQAGTATVNSQQVGLALYGPYLIGVELASFLLMAGLVGAYHLGRRIAQKEETSHGAGAVELRLDSGGDLIRAGADRNSRAT
ncbi:MAG TPA: NADH-quinone oxidoreductase subunit J [Candidatus Acidoferrales bacterium]|nr:NADH-quinone oxidoreductase subunit J [Candidatus Acidoferrales bacterium]